ncbi:conserved hypothetical protein, partial [Ricinus communis]
HAAVAFGDLGQRQQRRDAAVGAVQRIHHDQAAPVALQLLLQMLDIVVQEGHRQRAGGLHAFPQRGMGLHVEVHRYARPGQRLHQPDVGGPAGLRQDAVLGAHEARQLALQAVLRAALLQVHGRHQHLALAVPQHRHLRPDQRGLARQAQVIVTGQEDGAGGCRLPGVRMLAAQQLGDARDVVQIHAAGDKVRKTGVGGVFGNSVGHGEIS